MLRPEVVASNTERRLHSGTRTDVHEDRSRQSLQATKRCGPGSKNALLGRYVRRMVDRSLGPACRRGTAGDTGGARTVDGRKPGALSRLRGGCRLNFRMTKPCVFRTKPSTSRCMCRGAEHSVASWSPVERLEHAFSAQMRRHRPAHNAPTERINDNRQIHEPRPRRHVGHVSNPQCVRPRSHAVTLDQSRRRAGIVIAACRARPFASTHPGQTQVTLAQQPRAAA